MTYIFNFEKYEKKWEIFSKAFYLTALTVARFCDSYWDGNNHWFFPSPKIIRIKDNLKFVTFIESELDKLFFYLNTDPDLIFVFMLDKSPNQINTKNRKEPVKFDHHDTSDSWVLNLTMKEYAILQSEIGNNGLPTDLFIQQLEK